jgi:uncharacterized protein YkwD
MQRAFATAVLAALGQLGCAATTPPYAASNATKMTEAAAFAGAAAVAQVVESAMEARARNNAPTSHSTGVRVTQQCDNAGQYPCLSVEPSSGSAAQAPAESEMTDEEARGYVLDFLNSVRKLNGAGALVRDPAVDLFAQAGSEQLSRDRAPGQHMIDHGSELGADHAEAQASPPGTSEKLLQDRLGEILVQWMNEKPDGPHRGTIMRPEWRRVGVGIVSRDGRTCFTIDFSS